MNKWQKEAETSLLQSEAEAVEQIQKSYQKALKDIRARIKALSADELTQSKIYQIEYQKALEQQVSTILDQMQSEQYDTISAYLTGCYQDGYCAAMYDIAKQGIPVTMPIQQDQVVKAVLTDSKLSQPLYSSMGKYLKPLKKAVSQEIARGISSSMHWNDIAANIERRTSIGYTNAIRIARTEGHRIQQSAKMDAMGAAKESGADVVKQWDSTMDGKTRPHHRQLDGQIRELDEPFEVAGKKAMAPGQFGSAAEDVNCRCVVLERPRWALDEDELDKLKEKAEFWGLDKSDDFESFKSKYLDQSSNLDTPEKIQAELENVAAEKKKKADEWWNAPEGSAEADKLEAEYNALMAQEDQLKAQLANANKGMTAQQAKKAAKASVDPDEAPKKAPASARKFADRYEADRFHRPKTEAVWSSLTDDERDALYQYTGSTYQRMNSLLRRGEYNPTGDGRISSLITSATNGLEKTSLPEAVQVRRGTDAGGVAGLFGVNMSDLSNPDLQRAMIGQRVTERGFMSTGVAEGAGFRGINFEITLPEGTRGIYAEPFSQFGQTNSSGTWDGKQTSSSVGGEAEFIVQRGSTFEIDRIDTDSRGYITNIVMHLVEQSL